jgi:hypothetical protein
MQQADEGERIFSFFSSLQISLSIMGAELNRWFKMDGGR